MKFSTLVVLTVVFGYTMFLIGKVEMIGFNEVAKHSNYGGLITMAVGIYLAKLTFCHWIDNILEWTNPPELPKGEGK